MTTADGLVHAKTWDELDKGFKQCVENIKESEILAGLWILKMRESEAWRGSWDNLEDYFTGPIDAGGCGFGSYQTPTRWARVAQKYIVDLGCSLEDVGRAEHTKLDLISGKVGPENLKDALADCQPVAFGGVSTTDLKRKWLNVEPKSNNDGGLTPPSLRLWPFQNAPQKWKDKVTERNSHRDLDSMMVCHCRFGCGRVGSFMIGGIKLFPRDSFETSGGVLILMGPRG